MADLSLPAGKSSDNPIRRREQHRMRGTPIYGVYTAMIRRCYNPNCQDYHRYGGRGIVVCDRWRNSFLAFYADMGDRPERGQIDRIDTNGHYEPGNCRWTTSRINNRNRRDSVYLEFRGERIHISELAERFGLKPKTLKYRLNTMGLSVEEAVILPMQKNQFRSR